MVCAYKKGLPFLNPPKKKGIYDLTEHLVSILILVGWEFLRKSDYKYSMLILLKIAFSVSHSKAFRDLLMVSLWSEVQGGKRWVLLQVGLLVKGQLWCGLGLLRYVVSRAIVELGLSSQFTPLPTPLSRKNRASRAGGTGRFLNN